MTNDQLESIYNELKGVLNKQGIIINEEKKEYLVCVLMSNGEKQISYINGNSDLFIDTLLSLSSDKDALLFIHSILDFALTLLNRDFTAGDDFIQRLLAGRREILNRESETKVVPLN